MKDIIFLCADGLKGLPEAVEASFPATVFQTCIVHVLRSSMRYVSWKDRKAVCEALKPIYTAPSVEAAERALDAFETEWGPQFPTVVKSWRSRWERDRTLSRLPTRDSSDDLHDKSDRGAEPRHAQDPEDARPPSQR